MTRVIIFHSDRFNVVSYGDGLAYAIHDNIAKKSMFIQGDDAALFREELKAFEETFPKPPYDDFYAEQLAMHE